MVYTRNSSVSILSSKFCVVGLCHRPSLPFSSSLGFKQQFRLSSQFGAKEPPSSNSTFKNSLVVRSRMAALSLRPGGSTQGREDGDWELDLMGSASFLDFHLTGTIPLYPSLA